MNDYKVDLSPQAWGLFTASYAEPCIAAAKEMNEAATVAFQEAGIERLNRKEIIKVAERLYTDFARKFGRLGAGDTEGRYGVEDAVIQYLKAHDVDTEHDVDLNGDFLL